MPPQQPTLERNSKDNMRDSTTTIRHKKGQELATEMSTAGKEIPMTTTSTNEKRPLSSKPKEKTVPPLLKRFGRLSFRSKSTTAAAAVLPAVPGKRRLSLRGRSMPNALQSGTSSSAASTDSKEFREGPDGVNVPLVVPVQQTKIITVQGSAGGNDDDTVIADEMNNATANIMDERAIAERQSFERTSTPGPYCATAILHHSYLELLCGTQRTSSLDDEDDNNIDNHDNDHSRNSDSSSTGDQRRRRRDNNNNMLPDDPTVQESIECVFASQLEEGLPSMLLEDDDDEYDEYEKNIKKSQQQRQQRQPELMAPSRLQQSLLKNRSEAKLKGHKNIKSFTTRSLSLPLPPTPSSSSQRHHHNPTSLRLPKKEKIQQRLVHVGTYDYDPARDSVYDESKATLNLEYEHARTEDGNYSCPCRHQTTPVTDSVRWPQRPLLMRPTPDQGTRIHGIRFSSDADSYSHNDKDTNCEKQKEHFLWDAGSNPSSNLRWPGELKRRHFGKASSTGDSGGSNFNNTSGGTTGMGNQQYAANNGDDNPNPTEVMCSQCMILPINNGNEPQGKSLVTDFETDLFQGSLLVRIRNTEGTCEEAYDDNKGYFKGMNRRYQVVIRGKFKKNIPLTECLSGFQLARPCGKLPPKFIFKGALKVISFFAPQLQVKLDGQNPSSLTPFGSTPQTIIVQQEGETLDMEGLHQEPVEAKHTVLGEASGSSSALQRTKIRKKAFDKLFTQNSKTPLADTNKVYTFEFLQHMFNFQDFTIELGSIMGSVKFQDILEGQPLQIMAMHGNQKLWCFDIWHECLLADSKRYDQPKVAAV
jgi:hypothetical protein